MDEPAAPAVEAPEAGGEALETPSAPAFPAAPETAEAEAPAQSPVAADEPGLEVPFKLEDVPQEYREHVERLDKQFKAALTRARQDDRTKHAEAIDLYARLQDPEQADAALNELAASLGFEPAAQVEPEPPEEGVRDPRVDELVKAQEAQRAAEQQQILRHHVADALINLEEQRGDDYELPAEAREFITFAGLNYPGEDGLPDMARAVANYEALEASIIDGYLRSKDVPAVVPGSGGGVPLTDTSTPDGRLAIAEKIANRHFAQT